MRHTWFIANLPNIISIARLALVPIAIGMIMQSYWVSAFVVFVVAGISDALDGALAARLDLRSELGSYLDPLADKALLVSIYVTLALVQVIPDAIAILVVARDVMIVVAVAVAWIRGWTIAIHPLFVSKLNTAAQIAVAALVLSAEAFGFPPMALIDAGLGIVAALTIASAIAYLTQWSKIARAQAKGRVASVRGMARQDRDDRNAEPSHDHDRSAEGGGSP